MRCKAMALSLLELASPASPSGTTGPTAIRDFAPPLRVGPRACTAILRRASTSTIASCARGAGALPQAVARLSRPGATGLSHSLDASILSNETLQGYFGSNTLRFRGIAAARLSSCCVRLGPRGVFDDQRRGSTNVSSQRLARLADPTLPIAENELAVLAWVPRASA